jgi:hypothetical protein
MIHEHKVKAILRAQRPTNLLVVRWRETEIPLVKARPAVE